MWRDCSTLSSVKELTRQERNELFQIIGQNSLNPGNFELKKITSRINTVQVGYVPVSDDAWAVVSKENPRCFFTVETSDRYLFAGYLWPELHGIDNYAEND